MINNGSSLGKINSKPDKYDRQIRLWGDKGQNNLEKSKVCLVNVNATGTEILKNLVLPGIGSFTIIDGRPIRGEDIGNNFFLEQSFLGNNKAQVACQLLKELNETVVADYVDENVDNILQNNNKFFLNFSIVIATDLNERTLLQLSDFLWLHKIPLLYCSSYGFFGYMRLAIPIHTIVESHPDNIFYDLRLDKPFNGLKEFCNLYDFDKMSKKNHSHTPWLIVLFKYLEIWKIQHNGNIPLTYQEKNDLKKLIKSGILIDDDGNSITEENFEEAIKSVNTALNKSLISNEIIEIFNDELCLNINNKSENFWLLVRALKEYVNHEGDGCLPVRGDIPDMISDSESYIKLQKIYQKQAHEDSLVVTRYLQDLLSKNSIDNCNITNDDIKMFYQSVEEDDDTLAVYVLFRAINQYYLAYSSFPGIYNVDEDISCILKLIQQWKVNFVVKDDLIHEFCNYGASELHSVSAYMGGCAAQEIIKILTEQYIPFNNTLIYNGIKQTTLTFKI